MTTPDEVQSFPNGVWFKSSCSGLHYTNRHAAGDVSCVVIDGKYFYETSHAVQRLAADAEGELHDFRRRVLCDQLIKLLEHHHRKWGDVEELPPVGNHWEIDEHVFEWIRTGKALVISPRIIRDLLSALQPTKGTT